MLRGEQEKGRLFPVKHIRRICSFFIDDAQIKVFGRIVPCLPCPADDLDRYLFGQMVHSTQELSDILCLAVLSVVCLLSRSLYTLGKRQN